MSTSSSHWQGVFRRTAQGAWPNAAAALPWLVLSLVAFRSLAGFDPGRPLTHEASPLFVPADTAPGFVYGLIAFILYMRHRQIARALREGRPSPLGLLLVLPAAAVFAWARHTGAGDIELLSLVPWTLGAALLLGGRELTRLLLLPVLLLLFAFPIPAVLTNQIVYAFQIGTATLSTAVLHAIGVPAVMEGDTIYARGFAFEVIETCSGLRITETLLLSAFAYGQILCQDRRHQIALVLIAPALGFLLNTARVLMIVFTPHSYAAQDHTIQGLVVIVLGVFALAGIDSLLHRRMPARAPAPRRRPPPPDPSRSASPWPWAAAAAAAALCVLGAVVPQWSWAAGRPPWGVEMPARIDDWTSKKLDDDGTYLGSVAYVRSLHRRYERDGVGVEVFLAMDDRLQRDRSIVSPKHRVPGAAWEVVETRSLTMPWAPAEVLEIRSRSRDREILAYQWYEGDQGLARETFRQLAAIDNSVLRPGGNVLVHRVSTDLGEGPDARAAAEARLAEFAVRLRQAGASVTR